MFKKVMFIIMILVSVMFISSKISIGKWSQIETMIGKYTVFINGNEEIKAIENVRTHWFDENGNEWYTIEK